MKRDSYQGYNCFCIYDAFERAGRTSSVPTVGSLIVFKHSHIGRVTAVKNSRLFTNEGNTSALYGDSNGGTVKNKDYALDDANILGYFRMDYADGQETDGLDEAETDKPYLPRRRVEEFQKWMNTWYPELIRDWCGDLLKEDGVFGVMTKKAAIIVWKDVLNRLYGCELDLQKAFFDDGCRKTAGKAVLRNGSGGTLTAIAEGLLASRGIYKGNIDAMFGNAMEAAVMEFQRKQSLLADGIIGKRTWEKLLL